MTIVYLVYVYFYLVSNVDMFCFLKFLCRGKLEKNGEKPRPKASSLRQSAMGG